MMVAGVARSPRNVFAAAYHPTTSAGASFETSSDSRKACAPTWMLRATMGTPTMAISAMQSSTRREWAGSASRRRCATASASPPAPATACAPSTPATPPPRSRTGRTRASDSALATTVTTTSRPMRSWPRMTQP